MGEYFTLIASYDRLFLVPFWYVFNFISICCFFLTILVLSVILQMTFLVLFPIRPEYFNILFKEWIIKPLHPTFIGSQHACQLLCLHFNTRPWYFDNFLSWDSSIWSSHGTVNSHIICLVEFEKIMSGQNVFVICLGKLQLFPYVHFELLVLGSWKPVRSCVYFWMKILLISLVS